MYKHRQRFAELLSACPDHMTAFTDESFVPDSTHNAFVIWRQVLYYRLHKYNSVVTAELYAIAIPKSSVHPAWIPAITPRVHRLAKHIRYPSGHSPEHPIASEILTQVPTFGEQRSLLRSAGYLAKSACRRRGLWCGNWSSSFSVCVAISHSPLLK